MKTIYTFTLISDKYSKENIANDIRLIAYILYDSIYNYYGDGVNPLNINDKVKFNDLREKNGGNNYEFLSEIADGEVFYEPFVVGERAFGFTLCDDRIGYDILMRVLTETLRLLNLNYQFEISNITYEAEDEFDESNREAALEFIYGMQGCKYKKKDNFFTRWVNNISAGRKRR